MDEVLKRIESLLPRKPDGSLVHGCKKELTDFLGLPSNTMAEWLSGRNKSYRNFIAQIAEYYDVSANWILGLTDVKEKSAVSVDTTLHETGYDMLSDANRAIIDDLIAKLLKSQSDD